MMNKIDFMDEINNVPVWDTHTHLDDSEHLVAQNFWDIAHYFWFQRELSAAGYPSNASALSEETRIHEFVAAFQAARSTYWSWTVRKIFMDLYNVEITDVEGVKEADRRIRETARRETWAKEVCKRIALKRIVAGHRQLPDRTNIEGMNYCIPVYNPEISEKIKHILSFGHQGESIDTAEEKLVADIDTLYSAGYRSVRIEPNPFDGFGEIPAYPPELKRSNNSELSLRWYLGHALIENLQKYHFHFHLANQFINFN